jgi:hypothetical protein
VSESCPGIARQPRPANSTGTHKPRTGSGVGTSRSRWGIPPHRDTRIVPVESPGLPKPEIAVRGPNREFVKGESRGGQVEFKNPSFPEGGKEGGP